MNCHHPPRRGGYPEKKSDSSASDGDARSDSSDLSNDSSSDSSSELEEEVCVTKHKKVVQAKTEV